MTYALWLAEFALECLGAWLCFRTSFQKVSCGVVHAERAGVDESYNVDGLVPHLNKRLPTSPMSLWGLLLSRVKPPRRPYEYTSKHRSELAISGFQTASIQSRPQILLGSLLAFLAASDAILFIIFQAFGSYALAWACWYQKTGKYALLLLLACQVCGKLLGEEWRASLGTVATLGGLLVAWTYQGQETLAEQLLDAEISAAMFLCALICLAWLSRSERLKGFEKWKAAGLLICLGSDVVFTALWTHWDWARNLYPIGAILSLTVWAWGLYRKHPATELRLDSIGSPRGEALIEDETLESMVM